MPDLKFNTITLSHGQPTIWQWLAQGVIVHKGLKANHFNDQKLFYDSKIQTLKYYFEYELPKSNTLVDQLKSEIVLLCSPKENYLCKAT